MRSSAVYTFEISCHKQWEPLSTLFLEISEVKNPKSTQQKAQAASNKLLSSEVKANALFHENVITVIENANALLQEEEPLVHCVRSDQFLNVSSRSSVSFS